MYQGGIEAMRTIPFSSDRREQIAALSRCKLARDWDREFVRGLASKPDPYLISPKQAATIDSLYHRYLGQIEPQTQNSGQNASSQTN
jgi:hypothetical protein